MADSDSRFRSGSNDDSEVLSLDLPPPEVTRAPRPKATASVGLQESTPVKRDLGPGYGADSEDSSIPCRVEEKAVRKFPITGVLVLALLVALGYGGWTGFHKISFRDLLGLFEAETFEIAENAVRLRLEIRPQSAEFPAVFVNGKPAPVFRNRIAVPKGEPFELMVLVRDYRPFRKKLTSGRDFSEVVELLPAK